MKPASVLVLLPIMVLGCDAPAVPAGPAENPRYGEWQENDSVPVRFEQLWVIGGEDVPVDEMLTGVGDVEVDPAGNVYLSDSRNARITSFGPDGRFRWVIEERGSGPGELNSPMGMAVNDTGQLVVANQTGRRIDVFDASTGEYIQSVETSLFGARWVTIPGFLDDSTLVLARAPIGQMAADIFVVDLSRDWKVLSQFQIEPAKDLAVPSRILGSLGTGVLNGMIAAAHHSRYEIQFYDRTGIHLHAASREMEEFGPPSFSESQSRLRSTVRVPNTTTTGFHFVHANWVTNVPDWDAWWENRTPTEETHTLDLFDPDWKLLYSIEGEDFDALGFEEIETSDAEGNLYVSLEGDEPRLAKIRVHIDGE